MLMFFFSRIFFGGLVRSFLVRFFFLVRFVFLVVRFFFSVKTFLGSEIFELEVRFRFFLVGLDRDSMVSLVSFIFSGGSRMDVLLKVLYYER